MGSMSIWHWLIVLLVVVMIFGTRKLRNIGSDLGEAVKNFRQGVKDSNPSPPPAMAAPPLEQAAPHAQSVQEQR